MSIHISVMGGQSSNPDVMADAERWYARLMAADCKAAERMAFQRWQAIPEHAAAYAATEKLWQSVGRLAGRSDLEQLSRQILADTAKPPRRSFQRRRFAIAASVLVAAGVGVFLAVQNRGAEPVTYATGPSERSTIKLADGSQLILNFSTELDVQLDDDDRHLTLRKGEALFTVAQDATRPFRVTVIDGEVTALGTRFQVRSEAEQVTVTLLEGRVAVERPRARTRVQLAPGEQIRFAGTDEMSRRIVDPESVASWTTGRLRFRAVPLADVVDEVNRYSAVQIRIADPTLTSIPISGTFEIGDSPSVIAALEALLPIQAAEESHAEVLLRHR